LKVATLFRFGLVTALVIAATSIGYADVKHMFVKGDVVSAAAMNENFADLDQRITAARVATNGTSSYSMGATKACPAAPATDGNIGKGVSGYMVAKKACETSCNSKTAHMCSAEETVRLAQMGTPPNPGWISTGLSSTTPGPTAVENDCYGWTTNVGTVATPPNTQQFGTVWTGMFAGFAGCNTMQPISCCD
jgi:hypothetical protein